MAVPVIDSALKLVEAGIKYLTLLLKTSHVRRLRLAVDWGEKYIQEDEKLKTEDDAGKRADIYKKKAYIKRKFFRYNQG